MHIHTLEQWQHRHNFATHQRHAEKNTLIVMGFTAAMMVAEIIAGTLFGSMALLADGWHMATHVAAFGITIFAYRYARQHAGDPKYTFGTGKVSVLGGFASAVALAVVAFLMAFESVERFFSPHPILFNEAIGVATLGLVVNLASAWLLHDHDHHGGHDHHHPHAPDQNLRAAYFHVIADALTSVFAIVALFAGKFFGWVWLDALMGIVGAIVITRWAYGLLQDTSAVLLDGAVDKRVKRDIISSIEADADNRIADLHVWYLDQNHLAATISLVTHDPKSPTDYKQLLAHIPTLSHVLVEVNQCQGEPCVTLSAS
ncbi:CDF family Co(II)/Ni(II) efflux transporter DmeF [Halomicronema sp. CCY15110]|uniref:CDF family Co(II)/Ni(II) efflux transporter DmeF n=1 Tax=Halomicronema sp. CCY15110 TaxID=2767773 RepID=UPI0019503823|nr:CDF family Co(II)/Ni(II) efflux transporter DmeF [Halomicronema sp. CCY15110]